ncbi:MAG: hypothetical protein HKL81_00465 [Acidimicrobiaceae bacterium]|nr:hypothetical protein [Acidimicrobiaceae bacterium]
MAPSKRLSKSQAERLGVALDELDTGSTKSALEILRGILAEFFGVEDPKVPLLDVGWPIWLVDAVLTSGMQAYSGDEIKVVSDVICAMIELRDPSKFVPGDRGQ